MIKSPYNFDEGAAGKIAAGIGKRVNSALQFRGKLLAGPLKVEEKQAAAEAKANAKKKAFEEGHSDRLKKTAELSVARSTGATALAKERTAGSLSIEQARQKT
jgi:hypothetical protein